MPPRLNPASCSAAAATTTARLRGAGTTKKQAFRPVRASSSSAAAATPGETHHRVQKDWAAQVRARVGKCVFFGLDAAQVRRAAGVLRALTAEWRELQAGSAGYLTGSRRGMEGREVAWGEMDSFGHVNNAHYLRYAETSRVNWILHFAELDRANRQAWRDMMTTRGTGVIMRGILAQYSYPLTYPDKISVYHRLHRVPDPQSQKTSFSLDCVILSHQHRRVAATTVEDVVVYDYPNRRRAALPAFALDMFRETFRLQEEQQQRSLARIADLMKEVESLEKETWDRKDAKEDLGGAKAG